MRIVHPDGASGTCCNCHQRKAYCKFLCLPCYRWWQRHGSMRPRHRDATHCIICGRPRTKQNRLSRGRCRTCYQYWWKTGEERPQELIDEQAPYGWCDCGVPATRLVELEYGGIRKPMSAEFALCESCFNLEVS